MKLKRAIAASAVFGLLLGLVYYIHIAFFRVNVVFYASLLDVVLPPYLAESHCLQWIISSN